MSDLICRKSMMRCQTPGMCSPHGGCQASMLVDTNVRYAATTAAILGAENLNKALDTADELRAEVCRLKAELAELAALKDYVTVPLKLRCEERLQLKAENEALRKDAERYRWLRGQEALEGGIAILPVGLWVKPAMVCTTPFDSREMTDSVVDAAMAQEAAWAKQP